MRNLFKIYKLELGLTFRRLILFLLKVSHTQGKKKNIVLITTRRGGGTFLSELIGSTDNSMRICHHIFSWYQNDFYTRLHFNVKKNNQEIRPDFNNTSFFKKINTGKIIPWTSCNIFNQNFVRNSNRIIYKITEAKGLFDWFVENEDIITFYQVRHPIPTSLSILKNEWELTVNAYLKDKDFVERFLKGSKYDYCLKIMNGDDKLGMLILNWVLENLIPLNSKYLKKVLLISYEEFILNPEKYLTLIGKELSIKLNIDIESLIRKPSGSKFYSSKLTNNAIKNNDKSYLISSWKKFIDDSYEKNLMSILETFEIDIYQHSNLTINPKYLLG